MVSPSAFFTSLPIPVVLAFGTQDSPCLPCVPICVLIQPIFSYLLCGLGFRTSSFLFVPPCYCSSSWVLLGTGYSSWLLDGEGFFLPPICFHTCLLVCSQLVSLFLYLHCDSSLWVLSVKGISLSPVPHFSLHCSVFFVLVALGTDSSPICFRTRLSTSLSHVAVLSGCFRGTVCSLSSVCLRACPPCSLQLMPLLLSLSLSLSCCSSL